ncbi:MAG TPA: hypothetical protein VHP37_09025 [Burkholderiales bacterium]|nr:hypothetical protein [Burkholderiales bacterium]
MTTQSSEHRAVSLLPAYIEARARHAEDAGLLTEKQLQRGDVLTTRYLGSEAQLRAARFLRIPAGFVFPKRAGGRKLAALGVFCPAAPGAELRCTLVKIAEDRFRLSIVNELLPVSSRNLAGRIAVYKYTELREGANAGPATVYVGPFASLVAAGIAPAEAQRRVQRAPDSAAPALWQSQPLDGGRYRFVVYHEAEARAHAQEEERGRSNFRAPEQYQDWLLEVVAASIGMIRRQLRIKTKRRYVYTVPERTLKELEAHFGKLRRTIARSEILVQKEDVRAETQRAELRRAALAAMRDGEFQRFLGKVTAKPGAQRKR